MPELKHGFKIDTAKCVGRMNCMRACPTHAIRVKNGKAHLIPELCIDCGSCLGVCPSKAISATTITLAELGRFKFKVAVASPALFTQFGLNDTPAQVGRALLDLGFDAVWEYAVDIELVDLAITDCVKKWPGPFPLISDSCPVVVRLVQVAYPSMVEQLLPIEIPREIAGREVKRKYSRELGLKLEEIAAIYITPCQAKSISILQPAEEGKSYLDGAIGISEIYNDILYRLRKETTKLKNGGQDNTLDLGELFHWGNPEGEFPNLSREHYLPLSGLTDVIRVFDDIEKGKLTNIEFLECHACLGGCVGGNLTVENLYVARSKDLHLKANMPKPTPEFEREVARRYAGEDFAMRSSIRPRSLARDVVDLRERVMRRKRAEEILKGLPLLNCGLCGAPSCKDHADDVASSRSEISDCVFLSKARIDLLRKIYKKGPRSVKK
jgi:Na+-translocating ferredoxin:NAD+ oxidoreductase RNF subunit RnfB